ncbi:MAG: hypothetical protein KBA26_15200, partial [Candidatus Delongbacteria bacterium]|nr:hypothetical protein [Candidatus Delongbacteria bacterium]
WISFHNESFLLDTPQPRTLQLGGYFYHSSYSFDEANMDYDFSTMNYGAIGLIPLGRVLSVGGTFGFADQGDIDYGNNYKAKGESGMVDPLVFSALKLFGANSFHLIGNASIPIGEKKIGEEKLNFGFGGRFHHAFNDQSHIAVLAKLNFYEKVTQEISYTNARTKEKSEYESGIYLNARYLFHFNKELLVYGRFLLDDKREITMAAAGFDFTMMSFHHIKGEVGLGLSDNAPDLLLFISFLPGF